MDFDDFKRMEEERQRKRFGMFKDTLDQVLKEEGSGQSADELLGQMMGGKGSGNPKTTKTDGGLSNKLMEAIVELRRETTDESVDKIVLRAVGLYRSIVRHALKGGTVQFVDPDGEAKTLKVRLKQP